MGIAFSSSGSKTGVSEPFEVSQGEISKRQKLSSAYCEGNHRLIPSLPDEISIQILARIPRIYYLKMKLVSHTWKGTLSSVELYNVRKELGTTEEWLYMLTKVENNKLLWYALDPFSKRWQRLPLMPIDAFEDEPRKRLAVLRMWNLVGSSTKILNMVRDWTGRKAAPDRVPWGYSIGAVDGCLYVLGGFSEASTLRRVWQYNPILNAWTEVNPMSSSRAFCKTGVLNNKLYAVGGVTRVRGELTTLKSAEVFDPHTGLWSQIPSMPFSKAQSLPTAFLAGMLKPIVTGMASYRGRLFVAQSLCLWPFYVDAGGEVYDPEMNSWIEMPAGMGDGWPVRAAGTKRCVTMEGELYALEPSGFLDSARVKLYDHQNDAWRVIVEDVPICDFNDPESECLLAGLHGKLHAITKDTNHKITVLQVDVQSNLSSFPLSSLDNSCNENAKLIAESETCPWRVIATRTVVSGEPVSCQTLKL